jgi:peptidoglycan-associated lipoprotein
MIGHSKKALFGLIFLVCLTLAGCSTPATTKPEVAATPSSPSPGKQEAAKPSPSKESIGTSSLDALREGKDPTTPASSPLKEIYFDYDRYDLSADARETLKANAAWLKSNASARVEIEGHCDERGTNEYNLALGAKRAQAAKDYLVTLGIPAQRVSTISYGKELPVCREQTEGCWQKNRRDRFVVMTARPAS